MNNKGDMNVDDGFATDEGDIEVNLGEELVEFSLGGTDKGMLD